MGEPLKTIGGQQTLNATSSQSVGGAEQLAVTVTRADIGAMLLRNVAVSIDSIGNEFHIPLRGFALRKRPYNIVMTARRSNGQTFIAQTKLWRLPEPQNSLSVSRLDSLYGGILARTGSSTWTTIFPYSFYVAGPWLRESSDNMQKLADQGYNVLHIVPAGGLGYDLSELDSWLNEADRIGLWIMLDMRWSYQVPQNIRTLVNRVHRHKNLLLWYTADEPGMLGVKQIARRIWPYNILAVS